MEKREESNMETGNTSEKQENASADGGHDFNYHDHTLVRKNLDIKTGFPDSNQVKSKDIIAITRADDDNPSREDGEVFTVWWIQPTPSARDSLEDGALEKIKNSKNISGLFELKKTHLKTLPAGIEDDFLVQVLPTYLSLPRSSNGEPNVHIIISTKSGTGLAQEKFITTVKPILDGLGLNEASYSTLHTKSPECVLDFAKTKLLDRANNGEKQTVLMLSGDGGVVDLLNGLLSAGKPSM
jgi:hypothetical protein